MEELLAEVRSVNRLLKLVFSEKIAERVEQASDRTATRAVLAALAAGEPSGMQTAALLAQAKDRGVGRRTVFDAITALERAGIIERPRHGVVALADFVLPYVTRDRDDATTVPVGEGNEP